MIPYEQIEPKVKVLAQRYEEILRFQAGHKSEAAKNDKKTVLKVFGGMGLLFVIIPVAFVALIILGIILFGANGLALGFIGVFVLFALAFIALFVFIIVYVVKRSSAEQKANAKAKTRDVKMEVMKPFLDLCLGQKTGYKKQGVLSDLIPRELVDQNIFTNYQPSDRLRDVVRAKMGQTNVVFGEKTVTRMVRQKGAAEVLVGKAGAVVDVIADGGMEWEQESITSLLMLADFHKSFDGTVSLFSYRYKKTQERWSGQKAEVFENQRFNELFAVYTTNPGLARYIFSPTMMERFINISEKYNCGMKVYFRNGDMLLQLDWDKDMLETNVRDFVSKFNKEKNFLGMKVTMQTWSTLDIIYPEDISVNANAFKKHYRDIASVFEIVEELQQNVRIWTKY